MDDLISRKAAIEALGERPENWMDTPAEIEAVRAYDNAIDNLKAVPSIPAVPLDKLCEWLADKALPAPCYYVEDYCPYEDFGHCDKDELPSVKDCWKMVLTKWMEGLDAAD